MPRQKIFNKKTSTTYALVHRPQNDPLIHDSEASSHVFAQVSGPTEPSSSSSSKPKKSKVKQRGDLEDEFGIAFRSNEGEAAEQGVFYDDTSYDYMQHMREIGEGAGAATWIEAPTRQGDKKRKEKQQSLEDALRGASLEDEGDDDLESVGGASFFSRTTGRNVARPKYEDQQDVPDAIAGFQPDMDPRLREVLEALDDEAYVEEEEDFFADLAREGGEEVDQEEFEAQLFNDDDDDGGWESDTTEKPTHEYLDDSLPTQQLQAQLPQSEDQPSTSTITTSTALPASDAHIPDSTTDGDWLATFAKSKATTTAPLTFARPNPTPSIAPSAAGTTYTSATNGGRKKRKGALTSASGYSMTSSALARTEALSVLDERFERIADSYMNDIPEGEEDEFDDSASQMTGMTGMSRASRVTAKTNATWKSNMTGRSKAGGGAWGGSQVSRASGRSDASSVAPQLATAEFDSMMDEFLGGVGGHGRGRRMKKGSGNEGYWGKQTGMEQLKEIRGDLGPARLTARTMREAGMVKQ